MNKSRKDLIDLCKENGIKVYAGKKKEEIVKLLTEEKKPKEKKPKEKNPKEKKPKEKKPKEKTITQSHIELFKNLGNYNDENCQFNRFVDFYDSLGVDIQKLIDAIFNEWEEENRQSGYFNSLLNGHKEKLNAY